ncbi:hypothetical protein GKD67_19965 [Parabacteroides distasonis]|uniref:Uncharacterized protein n=1 Tax=Parabacteroides distasonis TaxID=823 RepID=A0A7K0H0I4_PARDI|nr:hypothetical protein [Parabacteroides distasonis]
MQSHPLIFCITFCISIGLIFFPLNPQYTFRSVPHRRSIWKKTVSEGMFLAYRSFKSVTSVSTLCRYVLLHISH